MPDMNVIIDKALRGLIWVLPGLLILLGIILVLSCADRRPKRRDSDNQHPDDSNGSGRL
jgi:cytochrome c-type biogenesis protein CcmH/NrfF